jgi:hypothetical protein
MYDKMNADAKSAEKDFQVKDFAEIKRMLREAKAKQSQISEKK